MKLVNRAFQLFEFVPGIGNFFAVFFQGLVVSDAALVDPAVLSIKCSNCGSIVCAFQEKILSCCCVVAF